MKPYIDHTSLTSDVTRTLRHLVLVLFLGVWATACQDTTVPNLNDPNIEDFISNPTSAQVQAMAMGLLFGSRADAGQVIRDTEIIGRDGYNLDPADPRWVDQFLGPNLDDGDFGANHWLIQYRNVKAANILIGSVETAAEFSAAEKSAIKGFARTIKGLDLLRLAETRGAFGIAADAGRSVDDLEPIICAAPALTRIAALLDSALADLQAGGASFPLETPIEGLVRLQHADGLRALQPCVEGEGGELSRTVRVSADRAGTVVHLDHGTARFRPVLRVQSRSR